MSESVIEIDATLEASEVKDSSVETEVPSLLESANNKRRLDDEEADLDENDDDDETRSARKKLCIEDDTEIEAENDKTNVNEEASSVIEETTSKIEETLETTEVVDETAETLEMSHQEPVAEKSSEIEVIEEEDEEENASNQLSETTFNRGFEMDDDDEEEEAEDEMDEEQEDEEEEEMGEEEFDSDSDDEEMMSRVMNKANIPKQIPQGFHTTNDEPIELDDSSDDEPQAPKFETTIKTEVAEEEEDFPVDNSNILDESDNESENTDENENDENVQLSNLQKKVLSRRKKYANVLSDKLVRKAVKNLRHEKIVRRPLQVQTQKAETVQNEVKKVEEIAQEEPAKSEQNGEIEAMETSEVQQNEEQTENVTTTKSATEIIDENHKNHTEETEKQKEVISENSNNNLPEAKDDEKSAQKASESEPSPETISILEEIEKSSIEDFFNRFVVEKSSERSPSLDEISAELFNCLQMNKIEIQKITEIWNEKLNTKFKLRQLVEKVRRHRAVMEIETFGYKPETSGNNVHAIISSKSSTTTNSEGEIYDKGMRITNESVNRIIQDARATMRRDERQRIDDSSILSENVYDSTWNNIQNNSIQGRQGQIVDVQSIINDFRSKNPQEIPRRGRRVKSLNNSGLYEGHMSNHDEGHSLRDEYSSLSQDFSNISKSNRSNSNSFPEVSLHPVHQNLYRNHLNSPSELSFGGQQKSSLLQSILTKSTKSSPIAFQNQLPSTSTLARLLTAPERSLQSTAKQSFSPTSNRQSTSKVHNGEITITPINHSRNSKNFSMDEDENSLEPPLVIDENFDGRYEDKKSTEFICQGCRKNKAFFMCAGCSRQWYCSKECQESAWDSHSAYCAV